MISMLVPGGGGDLTTIELKEVIHLCDFNPPEQYRKDRCRHGGNGYRNGLGVRYIVSESTTA